MEKTRRFKEETLLRLASDEIFVSLAIRVLIFGYGPCCGYGFGYGDSSSSSSSNGYYFEFGKGLGFNDDLSYYFNLS